MVSNLVIGIPVDLLVREEDEMISQSIRNYEEIDLPADQPITKIELVKRNGDTNPNVFYLICTTGNRGLWIKLVEFGQNGKILLNSTVLKDDSLLGINTEETIPLVQMHERTLLVLSENRLVRVIFKK